MSTSDYYTVITTTGLRKLAAQMSGGDPVQLTHFVVGDRAHAPDPNATALGHEVFRAPVNALRQDPDNPAWIIVEAFIPAQDGGFWVREAGVLDKDGDLIAVARYPDTYKPRLDTGVGKDLYFRLILEHSNSDSIRLTIDPSVVLATREHVDDAIQTAIDTHRNDPAAHKAVIDAAIAAIPPIPEASTTTPGLAAFATQSEADAGISSTRIITPQTLKKVVGDATPTARTNRVGLVELATQTETETGTSETLAITPRALKRVIDTTTDRLTQVPATESTAGLVELATQSEADTGISDTRVITPKTLKKVVSDATPPANTYRAGLVELATEGEAVTGTSETLAVTPKALKKRLDDLSQELAQVYATVSAAGLVELATQSEADAGTSDTRVITPKTLKKVVEDATPTANTHQAGLVELATQSEADAGTSDTRVITPKTLKKVVDDATPTANTYRSGLVELATQSEVNTGTSDSRAVTPKTLAQKLDTLHFIPPGAVMYFAMDDPPEGWLLCDGRAVSRRTYADLYAAIGTTFGSGSGYSSFKLPELRGEFIRGWNSGRNVDSGRSFGSAQSDAFKSHSHRISNVLNGGYREPWNGGRGEDYHMNSSGSTRTTGGSETRPRNVALLPCIKT